MSQLFQKEASDTNRPQAVLETELLCRSYGAHRALIDLNLTIHAGEVFGYIGPNGAGKTTTFRILSGLMRPTSGKAVISGEDVTHNTDKIKSLVGFLPDNFGVYPALRVREYLDFFAAAYRIAKTERAGRIEYCLKIANALEFRDKLMGALSRGMKQRVGIAKTLLHDPAVLILDEPAATIDPRARMQMRELLRELAKLGKAVLVSSHILPELADVCDTVGILSNGRLVASGPVQQILRTVRQKRLMEITVLHSGLQAQEILAKAPGHWMPVQISPDSACLRYDAQADEHQLAQTFSLLAENRIPITSFFEVPVDLEDVFMKLTR